MKRVFIFIFVLTFLSVALVGCDKEKSEPTPTEEQSDDEVKATLVGKWQRTDLSVAGYKNGKMVTGKITSQLIINQIQAELPRYFEFTKTKFIMHNLQEGDKHEQPYTLDAKTSTMVIVDNDPDEDEPFDTKVKYELKDKNNTLKMELVLEDEEFFDEYDEFRATITLKRINAWPVPQ